ncbi:MAG: hypothetical protein NT170_03705 [Candidatus Moranbacteria bacterium]|nr:hypothetical protein [Candidatus Moranbacteria bacterium]
MKKVKSQRSAWSKKAVRNIARNIIKNDVIFKEKCAANKNIEKELLEWKKRLRMTKEDLGDVIDGAADVKDDEKLAKKITGHFIQVILANRKNNIEFIRWFYNFFEKYQIHRIWEESILEYIACGYYCPPQTTTIDIALNKDENIVELKLLPETSSLDLQNSWYFIKRELQKLDSHKTKKRRVPRTLYKNLEEQKTAKLFSKNEHHDGSLETDADILYKIYENDEVMSDKISQDQKRHVSRFRTNKHRLKNFPKNFLK